MKLHERYTILHTKYNLKKLDYDMLISLGM
jgi:hypothetical protein